MKLDKIMNEAATRQELENKLSILNTLLPNSDGRIKLLRLKEKEQIELQLALFENVAPEDEIIVDVEDEFHRTFERDTYDIRDIEIITVRPPRTANEILADRHKFSSSLYQDQIECNSSQNPMEGIVLGLAGTY